MTKYTEEDLKKKIGWNNLNNILKIAVVGGILYLALSVGSLIIVGISVLFFI